MATKDQKTSKLEFVPSSRQLVIIKDPSKLIFIKDNRPTREQNITEKIESLKRLGQLTPIIISPEGAIGDGQNRTTAAIRLGIPIEAVIDPNLTIEKIREMNTSQRNWTQKDYLLSYASTGDPNYARLLKLEETYGKSFTISTLIRIASNDFGREFKRGIFRFSEAEYRKACDLLDKVLDVRQYFKDATTDRFTRTYKQVLAIPKFDHSQFVERLVKYRELMWPCLKDEQYYERISAVYNRGRQNKLKIQKK